MLRVRVAFDWIDFFLFFGWHGWFMTICFECYQGAVFSISFSEDSPFLLAIGGSKGSLKVSYLFIFLFFFFVKVLINYENKWCIVENLSGVGHIIWCCGLSKIWEIQQSRIDLSLQPNVVIGYEWNVISQSEVVCFLGNKLQLLRLCNSGSFDFPPGSGLCISRMFKMKSNTDVRLHFFFLTKSGELSSLCDSSPTSSCEVMCFALFWIHIIHRKTKYDKL